MQITRKEWNKYTQVLSDIDSQAGKLMSTYIQQHGIDDQDMLLRYAMHLVQKYGNASSKKACELYDEIATLSNADVKPAEPAPVSTQHEVAEDVIGSLKDFPAGNDIPGVVSRNVKKSGVRTILKNAERDRCEFAWIPSGDACAFCFMLASAGWRKAGEKTLNGDHVLHIHSHCRCQYCIRFNSRTNVEGYDPDAMADRWAHIPGDTQKEKLAALQRELRAEKNSGYEDITEEALKNATPGKGKLIFGSKVPKEDRETGEWVFKTFGGNVEVLDEQPEEGKRPDSVWNEKFWEYKRISSKTSIDDRMRKAKHQLVEASNRINEDLDGTGVIIDIANRKMSQDDAINEINRIAMKRYKNGMKVIIKENDTFLKEIKVKK